MWNFFKRLRQIITDWKDIMYECTRKGNIFFDFFVLRSFGYTFGLAYAFGLTLIIFAILY